MRLGAQRAGAIGTPSSLARVGRRSVKPSTPASSVVTALLMAQSEIEYLFNTGPTYRQIAQPVPGNGNLIVITQNGDGAAPTRTVVNATTVATGQVNPAMAALSALLAFVMPEKQFVVGDGSVPGTSRYDLADDTTNGTDTRLWTDFTSVANAIETEFGSVQNLIECWYNADAAYVNAAFKSAFWQFYFGANADGSPFTLGGTVNARKVDHCLYDASAATNAKGRGVFARAVTKWRIITPMPFLDAAIAPAAELTNFSANAARLSEPARASLDALTADPLAASASLTVGPSAHICRFGATSTEIHPDTGNKDGQILLTWPFAIALLRAAGMTIGEPEVVSIEVPSDGSYADLVVSLPNGGSLTTLGALRGTTYGGTSPHQQAVTGIEISRAGGARRPVFRSSETGYPVSHRGTVTITDSGSGAPRRGRVRITPSTPFGYGDALSYLRGQATAALLEPRDFDLYPWFLIEHVPALFNAAATYPFEGIAVKPYQADMAVPIPAPAFVGQGANFDGGDYFVGTGLALPAGSKGLFSGWFRHTGPTWTASRTLFECRAGTTITMTITTAGSNRLTFRLNQDGSGTDTFTVPTNTFLVDTWYHILWAWDYANARFQLYVNGSPITTSAYSFSGSTKFDQAGATITQFGLGASTGGSLIWVGDMGHVYLNLNQTLDLSVQANREKFALNTDPVDLGASGALPTGSAPEFYYDGAAPAWNNKGTAGNFTLTGALTAASSPPSY